MQRETKLKEADQTLQRMVLEKKIGPPPITASGFGDPRANGVLTQDGMWNSFPAFRTPGGAYYHVADMDHYRCAPGGNPMNTMDVMYVNPVSGTVLGAYTLNLGGTPPAGTVA